MSEGVEARSAGPGSGPGGAPTAIALSPILSARYRQRDLERIRAAAPGATLVMVSMEGLAGGPARGGGARGRPRRRWRGHASRLAQLGPLRPHPDSRPAAVVGPLSDIGRRACP